MVYFPNDIKLKNSLYIVLFSLMEEVKIVPRSLYLHEWKIVSSQQLALKFVKQYKDPNLNISRLYAKMVWACY